MAKTTGGIRGNASPASLSELAADAVDYYVSGNGYNLNGSLRSGGGIEGEDRLLMKGLDEATSSPLGATTTLYRGVSAESIFGKDISTKYGLLKSGLVNNYTDADVAQVVSELRAKTIGKTFVDKGYMSTSKVANVGEGFGGSQPIVLRITAKKSTKGIDLNKVRSIYKNNTNEKEVLLARNTRYKITKLYAKDGHICIDATII